ncbi:hypothetical protein ABKN59_008780 [Abortiporus biennis]
MSKKGAKAPVKDVSYEIRDVVLAKVRGFPPWPGMIVNPESVPPNVAKERPNGKSKKGTWYCVRFFPDGDYAWMVPKDISKLQQHEIQAYINEPYKRSGDLLQGYRIALDPSKWEEERDAMQAEMEQEEDNAEVDQLNESDEGEDEPEEEEKKTKTKKRKRESEVAPKKSKAPKAKKDSAEPAEKKKKPAATKGKKNGTKSKAMVESEDEAAAEADEDAGPSKKASPPPAKKAKREKEGEEEVDPELLNDPEAQKVRDWRHKLQKAFLNTKAAPKDDDMPNLDELFTTVESYDNMTVAYLSFSKIGKVMRHIHALNADKVPRDSEFKFRDRAKVLVDKWHELVNANKANGDSVSAVKPATNGKAQANGKKKKEEKKEEASAEETPVADVSAMDVDAKGEEVPPESAAPEDSNADADAPAEEVADNADGTADAPGVGDESVLADVTMSEAAA